MRAFSERFLLFQKHVFYCLIQFDNVPLFSWWITTSLTPCKNLFRVFPAGDITDKKTSGNWRYVIRESRRLLRTVVHQFHCLVLFTWSYLAWVVSICLFHELGKIILISVILSPLRPASLTHKNPQRRKIICGMRRVEYSVRVVRFLWLFLWLLFNGAYLF